MSRFIENVKADFKSLVEQFGVEITVKHYSKTGADAYGQPQYSTTTYSMKGIIEPLGMKDVRYVEAGFLPEHYVYFYFPYDEVGFVWEQMKDEITYAGKVYIIRQIFLRMIHGEAIYYKLLCRRKEVT